MLSLYITKLVVNDCSIKVFDRSVRVYLLVCCDFEKGFHLKELRPAKFRHPWLRSRGLYVLYYNLAMCMEKACIPMQ